MKYLAVLMLAALPAPALSAQEVDHSGHAKPVDNMSPTTDPHAGHSTSAADDGHVGHPMPTTNDPHAGHAMPGQRSDPPVAGPSAAARGGPAHATDAFYGEEEMVRSRRLLIKENGALNAGQILIDQLETTIGKGTETYSWDAQLWYGGDINRLWLKTEGEGRFDGRGPDDVEVQALYSRALDPWFNLQVGVRRDFRAGPERTYAVVGIQGLAPYWFEVDGSLFLSDKGEVSARFEAEYDQRITQSLILQPSVEFELSAQDIPELGIGSGLSSAEAGLRLRYQIVPEFAPYIGVTYERAFGNTEIGRAHV